MSDRLVHLDARSGGSGRSGQGRAERRGGDTGTTGPVLAAAFLLSVAGPLVLLGLALPWTELLETGPVEGTSSGGSESGWQFLDRADVVFAALAVVFVVVAVVLWRLRRPRWWLLLPPVTLTALGIGTVIGHGADPADAAGSMRDPSVGPWVTLAGLVLALAGLALAALPSLHAARARRGARGDR